MILVSLFRPICSTPYCGSRDILITALVFVKEGPLQTDLAYDKLNQFHINRSNDRGK